jgi:hypothetical protein
MSDGSLSGLVLADQHAFSRDRGTIRRRAVAALLAGTLEEVVIKRPDSAGRMQTRAAYRPISQN